MGTLRGGGGGGYPQGRGWGWVPSSKNPRRNLAPLGRVTPADKTQTRYRPADQGQTRHRPDQVTEDTSAHAREQKGTQSPRRIVAASAARVCGLPSPIPCLVLLHTPPGPSLLPLLRRRRVLLWPRRLHPRPLLLRAWRLRGRLLRRHRLRARRILTHELPFWRHLTHELPIWRNFRPEPCTRRRRPNQCLLRQSLRARSGRGA